MSRQFWSEGLITSEIDGATLTAAAAASCIPAAARYTIPANFFDIGRALRIAATGRISSVIATPGTARFDVRFAGVVVFDGLAILLDTVAAHVNVGWLLEIRLTCRSIGNGVQATLMGEGKWICEDILGTPAVAPKGSLCAVLPWNTPPNVGGGFDSTIANPVDIFFTQTVATGSLTVHQYYLESLN